MMRIKNKFSFCEELCHTGAVSCCLKEISVSPTCEEFNVKSHCKVSV